MPMPSVLRAAVAADHEALLSPLDASRLAQLDAQSAYHCVVVEDARVVAFLLALREGADYDSPNYRWFAQRYPRFLYVDRIAVASTHQGRQIGRRLYEDLFVFARAQSIGTIACEFYVEPLNVASQRFHAGFGFQQLVLQFE